MGETVTRGRRAARRSDAAIVEAGGRTTTLVADDWQVELAQANIIGCRYRGVDILRPDQRTDGADPFAASYFPLAPYSNRIRDGKFTFARRTRVVEGVREAGPHPLHGIAWRGAWRELQSTPRSCVRRLETRAGPDWPWAFRLDQTIAVDGPAITFRLTMTNLDAEPAPAGLGFHPYFPALSSARIALRTEGVWLADADELPARWTPTPAPWDFGAARTLSNVAVDNCFTGWNGRARISWDDRPFALSLEADPALRFVVLFVSQAQDCFCIEPVSHMNDALNWTERTGDTGLRILAPGELWTTTFRIRID